MTLRRAVSLFPRPWIDGTATFDEWLLACAVIQAAIAKLDATTDLRAMVSCADELESAP